MQEQRTTQAGLQYQQAVLLALEEVENATVGYDRQQNRYASLQAAVTATQEAVRLVTVQYRTGLTDFNNVLLTQRILFQQQDGLVVARAESVAKLIALYKALGGGWNPGSPTGL